MPFTLPCLVEPLEDVDHLLPKVLYVDEGRSQAAAGFIQPGIWRDD
jgi:hypothetical protein